MQCSSFSDCLDITALPENVWMVKIPYKDEDVQAATSCQFLGGVFFKKSSFSLGRVACNIPPAQYPQHHSSEGLDKHISSFMGEVSNTEMETFSSFFPNFPRQAVTTHDSVQIVHGIAPDLRDFGLITGLRKCMDFQAFLVNQALHTGVQALEESQVLAYLQLSLLKMALFPVVSVPSQIHNKITECPKPFRNLSFSNPTFML